MSKNGKGLYPKAKTLGILLSNRSMLVQEYQGEHSRGIGFYYRPLGGAIEFGEQSTGALIREFVEELGEEIEIQSYVGCIENIFSINDDVGHELIQLYRIRFKNAAAYTREQFSLLNDNRDSIAKWVDCKDFLDGKKVLYPVELVSLLKGGNL